jgi:hypothetical protein
MPTTKRTTKPAAPKPITAQEALQAGRLAYETAIRSIETARADGRSTAPACQDATESLGSPRKKSTIGG